MSENERDPREQYANWKAPESTETKATVPEKKEPSFRQTTAEYTRALRDQFDEPTAEHQSERDYIGHVDRQLAKVRPEKPPRDFEVAEGLAEVAFDNGVIRENLALDQDLVQEDRAKYEKIQSAAKTLFMESGRVVFADVTPLGVSRSDFSELSKEFGNFSRNLKAISPDVEGLGALDSLIGQAGMEKDLVAKKNPRELLSTLDRFIAQASEVLKGYSRLNYNAELEGKDEKQLEGQRGVLAEYIKLIYRMELARDSVAQKVATTPDQERKPEVPTYEDITDANFEQYRTQGKEVQVNGLAWQVLDAYPDGRIVLERQRTKQEMAQSEEQGKKDGSKPLPSTQNHRVIISRVDLKSGGRWLV